VNPYFLWQLTDKDSHQVTLFTANDFSNAPYYYSTFTVSNTGISATAGGVSLMGGQFEYIVYEMTQPYNLIVGSAVGIVRQGLLTISPTSSVQLTAPQPSRLSTTNIAQNLNRR
jgi:hypothetical protein